MKVRLARCFLIILSFLFSFCEANNTVSLDPYATHLICSRIPEDSSSTVLCQYWSIDAYSYTINVTSKLDSGSPTSEVFPIGEFSADIDSTLSYKFTLSKSLDTTQPSLDIIGTITGVYNGHPYTLGDIKISVLNTNLYAFFNVKIDESDTTNGLIFQENNSIKITDLSWIDLRNRSIPVTNVSLYMTCSTFEYKGGIYTGSPIIFPFPPLKNIQSCQIRTENPPSTCFSYLGSTCQSINTPNFTLIPSGLHTVNISVFPSAIINPGQILQAQMTGYQGLKKLDGFPVQITLECENSSSLTKQSTLNTPVELDYKDLYSITPITCSVTASTEYDGEKFSRTVNDIVYNTTLYDTYLSSTTSSYLVPGKPYPLVTTAFNNFGYPYYCESSTVMRCDHKVVDTFDQKCFEVVFYNIPNKYVGQACEFSSYIHLPAKILAQNHQLSNVINQAPHTSLVPIGNKLDLQNIELTTNQTVFINSVRFWLPLGCIQLSNMVPVVINSEFTADVDIDVEFTFVSHETKLINRISGKSSTKKMVVLNFDSPSSLGTYDVHVSVTADSTTLTGYLGNFTVVPQDSIPTSMVLRVIYESDSFFFTYQYTGMFFIAFPLKYYPSSILAEHRDTQYNHEIISLSDSAASYLSVAPQVGFVGSFYIDAPKADVYTFSLNTTSVYDRFQSIVCTASGILKDSNQFANPERALFTNTNLKVNRYMYPGYTYHCKLFIQLDTIVNDNVDFYLKLANSHGEDVTNLIFAIRKTEGFPLTLSSNTATLLEVTTHFIICTNMLMYHSFDAPEICSNIIGPGPFNSSMDTFLVSKEHHHLQQKSFTIGELTTPVKPPTPFLTTSSTFTDTNAMFLYSVLSYPSRIQYLTYASLDPSAPKDIEVHYKCDVNDDTLYSGVLTVSNSSTFQIPLLSDSDSMVCSYTTGSMTTTLPLTSTISKAIKHVIIDWAPTTALGGYYLGKGLDVNIYVYSQNDIFQTETWDIHPNAIGEYSILTTPENEVTSLDPLSGNLPNSTSFTLPSLKVANNAKLYFEASYTSEGQVILNVTTPLLFNKTSFSGITKIPKGYNNTISWTANIPPPVTTHLSGGAIFGIVILCIAVLLVTGYFTRWFGLVSLFYTIRAISVLKKNPDIIYDKIEITVTDDPDEIVKLPAPRQDLLTNPKYFNY